jgi:hypothetical protein
LTKNVKIQLNYLHRLHFLFVVNAVDSQTTLVDVVVQSGVHLNQELLCNIPRINAAFKGMIHVKKPLNKLQMQGNAMQCRDKGDVTFLLEHALFNPSLNLKHFIDQHETLYR